MEEENPHEPMEKSSHVVRYYLAKGCSLITTVVYLLIAVLLVFAVVIAGVDAVQLLMEAMTSTDAAALTPAVQEILFIIVLATLIDLVRSYVKYGKILLRPILVAGITTMVRKLLVTNLTFADIIGVVIVILALMVSIIFLGREDRKTAQCAKEEAEKERQMEQEKPLFHLLEMRKKEKKAAEEKELK